MTDLGKDKTATEIEELLKHPRYKWRNDPEFVKYVDEIVQRIKKLKSQA